MTVSNIYHPNSHHNSWGGEEWWQGTNTKANTVKKKGHCRPAHLGMAISANASRLFCPPDSNAIGLSARSPLIPKEPNW